MMVILCHPALNLGQSLNTQDTKKDFVWIVPMTLGHV
jgi:hypothetical protein